MLEKEMEDLIATNPEHFFPSRGFVLRGRQQSFQGVGRFDLLFGDRHGMTILMELKAVPARYEIIDQVARYRDALVAMGKSNIIMWIVAPIIPPGMKDFLSHLGIEYTEIHESEFIRAAALFGYSLRDSKPEPQETKSLFYEQPLQENIVGALTPGQTYAQRRFAQPSQTERTGLARIRDNQNEVLLNCLRKYLAHQWTPQWGKSHRVTHEMHSKRIVSYAYIQHNTANLTCFRKSVYPTQTLKVCIEDFLQSGVISRVQDNRLNGALYFIQDLEQGR